MLWVERRAHLQAWVSSLVIKPGAECCENARISNCPPNWHPYRFQKFEPHVSYSPAVCLESLVEICSALAKVMPKPRVAWFFWPTLYKQVTLTLWLRRRSPWCSRRCAGRHLGEARSLMRRSWTSLPRRISLENTLPYSPENNTTAYHHHHQ